MIDIATFSLCALAVLVTLGLLLCCMPGFFKPTPSREKFKAPGRHHDFKKPVDDETLRKMAAAHMERVMTKEGWDL